MWTWLRKLLHSLQDVSERDEKPGSTSAPTVHSRIRAKAKNIYPKERANTPAFQAREREKPRHFRFPVIPDQDKRERPQRSASQEERGSEPLGKRPVREEKGGREGKPVREARDFKQAQAAREQREFRDVRAPFTEQHPAVRHGTREGREPLGTRDSPSARPSSPARQMQEKMQQRGMTEQAGEKQGYKPSEVLSPVYGKLDPRRTADAVKPPKPKTILPFDDKEPQRPIGEVIQTSPLFTLGKAELAEAVVTLKADHIHAVAAMGLDGGEVSEVSNDSEAHTEASKMAGVVDTIGAVESHAAFARSEWGEGAGVIEGTKAIETFEATSPIRADELAQTIEQPATHGEEAFPVSASSAAFDAALNRSPAEAPGSSPTETARSFPADEPGSTVPITAEGLESIARETAEAASQITATAEQTTRLVDQAFAAETPLAGISDDKITPLIRQAEPEAAAHDREETARLAKASAHRSESSMPAYAVSHPDWSVLAERSGQPGVADQAAEPDSSNQSVQVADEVVMEQLGQNQAGQLERVPLAVVHPPVGSAPEPKSPLQDEEDRKGEELEEPIAYTVPPLSLLNPSPQATEDDEDFTLEQKSLLEETLSNFNVSANVVGIVKGPSVTRFELQPAPGVKVNKITSLSDDIKLSLAAKDIRIEAPIPGRNAVGIEVPNLKSMPVFISRIIESDKFLEHPSPLAVALGMDIGGEPIVADIKKMPHGLIAGSTGSGKSVCINSIIVSLLYKASPEQVRLLLIDPKVVELAPYNHLPHLVTPVVTDAKQATAALKWAVEEMEKRYTAFAEAGVRDIERYNLTTDEPLPYIVIIIDELADLMMVSPQDVEDCIIRIAQKARACGIHLLLATQRPSVDVITGNIKANVPTRLAFAVFSQIDSRTIIDQSGAERLLGRGDMLFLESGTAPLRLQGNYVSDDEIERVTQTIKKQRKPNYLFSKEDLEQTAQSYDMGDDPLYHEALLFVADQGQASASALQRRFRIGYNRAARLIEMMEGEGHVAGQSGGKPRAVLITREDAQALTEGTTLL